MFYPSFSYEFLVYQHFTYDGTRMDAIKIRTDLLKNGTLLYTD